MDCTTCGACCLHLGYPPFYALAHSRDDDPEFLRLPPSDQQHLRQLRIDLGPTPTARSCCWYDIGTHRCTRYDNRPTACRAFTVGGIKCLRRRAAEGIASEKSA